MGRPGPLTTRHIAVTALVVLLVLAQLVWWMVYTIRESRIRLELEQSSLLVDCRQHAHRLETKLSYVESCLRSGGRIPAERTAQAQPWTALIARSSVARGPGCDKGWRRRGDVAILRYEHSGQCLDVELHPWPQWLETSTTVEIIEGSSRRAGVGLPPPFEDMVARPSFEVWSVPRNDHLARVRMFISEGVFFILLVASLVVLLGRTVRRELDLQQQHRNFLSAITHELKSPLASVRLSLETVLRGRADSTVSLRFLENALQDTERLQRLVQKVLEVTRFGRAEAALRLRRADLSEVVSSTIATFNRLATAAGARIEAQVEPEIWVRGDEESLAIVVSNLLENAIKYGGPVPRIELELRIDAGDAVLEVSDNGSGIPEEDLPFIFDRFYRGGNEMTRTTQGTGLGLYLVRQIVHAHRGTVAVTSSGPDGTTFHIVLPGAEIEEGKP